MIQKTDFNREKPGSTEKNNLKILKPKFPFMCSTNHKRLRNSTHYGIAALRAHCNRDH